MNEFKILTADKEDRILLCDAVWSDVNLHVSEELTASRFKQLATNELRRYSSPKLQ
jgi:hypothetical protein